MCTLIFVCVGMEVAVMNKLWLIILSFRVVRHFTGVRSQPLIARRYRASHRVPRLAAYV